MLWGKEGKTDHITIKEYVYEYDMYEIIQLIEFILKDCLYNLYDQSKSRAGTARPKRYHGLTEEWGSRRKDLNLWFTGVADVYARLEVIVDNDFIIEVNRTTYENEMGLISHWV